MIREDEDLEESDSIGDASIVVEDQAVDNEQTAVQRVAADEDRMRAIIGAPVAPQPRANAPCGTVACSALIGRLEDDGVEYRERIGQLHLDVHRAREELIEERKRREEIEKTSRDMAASHSQALRAAHEEKIVQLQKQAADHEEKTNKLNEEHKAELEVILLIFDSSSPIFQ